MKILTMTWKDNENDDNEKIYWAHCSVKDDTKLIVNKPTKT